MRSQYLSRCGQIADSFGDSHRHATDVIAPYLDLASVYTCPQLQPDVFGTGHDLSSTAKRSSGGVEGDQEAIPRRLYLLSSIAGERSSHEGVVTVAQSRPLALADPSLVRPVDAIHQRPRSDGPYGPGQL